MEVTLQAVIHTGMVDHKTKLPVKKTDRYAKRLQYEMVYSQLSTGDPCLSGFRPIFCRGLH
jgi:precorrin-6B methylase 1